MKRRVAIVLALAVLGIALGRSARADDPPASTPPAHAPPASEQPATPTEKRTTDADADALRGPAVVKHEERPERSIVERDFQGRVKKLEENPALVALTKLTLTSDEKEKVDKVLGDRAAALDTIVRDNLKLIIELGMAKQGGDAQEGNKLQAQVLEKAMPFLRRGPLINEIRPALPQEKFAELKRMVDEYNRVAAEDRMGDPMSGPKKDNKFGAMLAQGFEGFAAEAKASYQRVVEAGGKDFENLIKMLQLTAAQESKVRQIAMDMFLKTYGKPTKMQQLRVFLDIYSELDKEQRHRLAEYIGEENRVKRGVTTKKQ
jgi:hypothetical protein